MSEESWMSFASVIISEEYILELHSIMHGGFLNPYCGIYLFYFVALWVWAWLQLPAFHLNQCSNIFEAAIHPTPFQTSHSCTSHLFPPTTKAHHTTECCIRTLSTNSKVSLTTKSGSSLWMKWPQPFAKIGPLLFSRSVICTSP